MASRKPFSTRSFLARSNAFRFVYWVLAVDLWWNFFRHPFRDINFSSNTSPNFVMLPFRRTASWKVPSLCSILFVSFDLIYTDQSLTVVTTISCLLSTIHWGAEMPINVFRQCLCPNTTDSICDHFKWVCDKNKRWKAVRESKWQTFMD